MHQLVGGSKVCVFYVGSPQTALAVAIFRAMEIDFQAKVRGKLEEHRQGVFTLRIMKFL